MTFLVIASFISAVQTSQIGISAEVLGSPTPTPTPCLSCYVYHNINLGEGIGSTILTTLKGTAQFTALVTDSMMSTSSGATDLVVLWVMIGVGFVGVVVMFANGYQRAQKIAEGKEE